MLVGLGGVETIFLANVTLTHCLLLGSRSNNMVPILQGLQFICALRHGADHFPYPKVEVISRTQSHPGPQKVPIQMDRCMIQAVPTMV